MLTLLYDGSFDGLLTAVFEAFRCQETTVQIQTTNEYIPHLFVHPQHISTDFDKAQRVCAAVREKISGHALKNCYYVYLSEIPQSGDLVLQYLRLGFSLGPALTMQHGNEVVHAVQKLSQKVGKEKHRLMGLVRFRKLEKEIYYAPIEPDYQVLTLLAPHFAKRMADQHWVLHDVKREQAILFNQQEWVLTPLKEKAFSAFAEDEAIFQQNWKTYFTHIAIPERKNLRQQKLFMPARYWKHLVELDKDSL